MALAQYCIETLTIWWARRGFVVPERNSGATCMCPHCGRTAVLRDFWGYLEVEEGETNGEGNGSTRGR